MTTTKKTSKATRKPADLPAPEWGMETPESGYDLEAWTDHSGTVQSVDLTRDEYEALKLHLAKMRGYKLPAAS